MEAGSAVAGLLWADLTVVLWLDTPDLNLACTSAVHQ